MGTNGQNQKATKTLLQKCPKHNFRLPFSLARFGGCLVIVSGGLVPVVARACVFDGGLPVS